MKTRSEGQDLASYLDWLTVALGHADREAGLRGYCQGLMLPLERKSVEPIAAQLDPRHVRARHQALHHFVAQSDWSDTALLRRVTDWVLPHLVGKERVYWIIDDTGIRKKGRHSVGVARQYCGQIGKQDNCQVAVSLSIATVQASLPVAWQLYLPSEWAADATRRREAGVPEDMVFATKPDIALAQVRQAHAAGLPIGCVLADAAYGTQTQWREALSELQLEYAVGVVSSVGVWAPGSEPLPPKPKRGTGRPTVRRKLRNGQGPVSVKSLALQLDRRQFRTVRWREGTNTPLSSRFAALRVRVAHRDPRRAHLCDEEWLLIEWPRGKAEPAKYWLSNLPPDTILKELVATVKARWRIERDYEELKQEFGLAQYEGRGWRGFHHHASLCIAAYGFLVGRRLRGARQKKPSELPQPALPRHYRPRGAATSATTRRRLYRDAALAPGSRARTAPGAS
ncbi:MAG: IS701 family transposase [Rudaea sp.]